MRPLVIAGVDKESGKTVVALGIALNHPGTVEYIKPLRDHLVKVEGEVCDRDAMLAKRVLDLQHAESEISPYDLDVDQVVDADELLGRIRALAETSDLQIVETGQTVETGMCVGASGFDIAERLGTGILLVSDSDPCLLDRIKLITQFAEGRGVGIAGVIVNNDQDGKLAGLLSRQGVRVLGTIPFEPRLRWFRAREILEDVGGECIAGSRGLDRIVRNVVIGAMTAESALPLMRRIQGKCLVTGGDRSDLLMAALTTDTSALVLTGGLRPSSHVLSEAHEQGVPVIVISGDTYSVIERFEGLEMRINPDDRELLDLVGSLVRDNVDLEALIS